ncbi:MAG: hypothetical protein OEY43_09595, partial [Gammaproteobacteria bacterium]|nr:hypothetical protein [Gammaproteobacteria bacterium]
PLCELANAVHQTIVVVRIPSGLFNLRQLRGVIETACKKAGENTKVMLIVEGEPPDIELMRNAKLIYDML